MNNIKINTERFQNDFSELSQIGLTGDGGVSRPAFSNAYLETRAWFRDKIEEAGLEFRTDGADNHSAYLSCGQDKAGTLMLGSHLDSVPNGGPYDGALGVLAALEVLRVLKENDLQLPVNLEAIDFTDEEGTLGSFLGSFALSGKLNKEQLAKPRGGREALLSGLERAGLTDDSLLGARRDPGFLAGYLELHVEQGPRLADSGVDIGVVSSIAGICFYRLTFFGRADHSGTMPMDKRKDAALGASAFTLSAHELVSADFPECLVNIGQVKYEPGSFNIVPEKAVLSLEFRAPVNDQLEQLEAYMLKNATASAKRFGLTVEAEFLGRRPPTPLSQEMQSAVVAAANELGLSYTHITSGPGHDAQAMADLCPTGMIFVPSVKGISHSPEEFTEWRDCLNGVNTLLHTLLTVLFNNGEQDVGNDLHM